MASQTIENYLKAIYLSAHPGGTVTTSELAALGVRLPTVNSMVKRLGEKGLSSTRSTSRSCSRKLASNKPRKSCAATG